MVVGGKVYVADHVCGKLAGPPPNIVSATLEARRRVVPLAEPPGDGGEDVRRPQPSGMIVDDLAGAERPHVSALRVSTQRLWHPGHALRCARRR